MNLKPALLPLLTLLPIATSSLHVTAAEVAATEWIKIKGADFIMGDSTGDDNEKPTTESVEDFEIMRFEVTNSDFVDFVSNTGYITDVERGSNAFVWTKRWRTNAHANYKKPHGLESSITVAGDHPVMQVSARDAEKYCAYLGARLPTEIEWEYAARGNDGRRFPWGNQVPSQKNPKLANFGTDQCCAPSDSDGYSTTSPVGSYPEGASPFGVEDMAGNVWEWTTTPFPGDSKEQVIRGGGWGNNAYCLRVSYRHGNPPNIGLNMVGFRCAR